MKKTTRARREVRDYAVIEVIDEWRPAIGSNSAANIFERNIGIVIPRRRYRSDARRISRVCIYDLPPISDLR